MPNKADISKYWRCLNHTFLSYNLLFLIDVANHTHLCLPLSPLPWSQLPQFTRRLPHPHLPGSGQNIFNPKRPHLTGASLVGVSVSEAATGVLVGALVGFLAGALVVTFTGIDTGALVVTLIGIDTGALVGTFTGIAIGTGAFDVGTFTGTENSIGGGTGTITCAFTGRKLGEVLGESVVFFVGTIASKINLQKAAMKFFLCPVKAFTIIFHLVVGPACAIIRVSESKLRIASHRWRTTYHCHAFHLRTSQFCWCCSFFQ